MSNNVRSQYEDYIEIENLNADILNQKDSLIMVLYSIHGLSLSNIARIMSISESSISRRLRKIKRRLSKRRYYLNLFNKANMSVGQMNIALDYFVRGSSLSEISDKRHVTIYSVRRTIAKVRNINDKIKKTRSNK